MEGTLIILIFTLWGTISILLGMKAEPNLVTLIKVIGVASIIWLGVIAGALMSRTQKVWSPQPIKPSVKIKKVQIDNKTVSDTTYIYDFTK
jgi:threonine/homoserine/homoserine lactone efflux protein